MTDMTSKNNNNNNNRNNNSSFVHSVKQSLLLPTNRRSSHQRERVDGQGWNCCLVYSVGWTVCGLLALSGTIEQIKMLFLILLLLLLQQQQYNESSVQN
jgi:hypothetical protein